MPAADGHAWDWDPRMFITQKHCGLRIHAGGQAVYNRLHTCQTVSTASVIHHRHGEGPADCGPLMMSLQSGGAMSSLVPTCISCRSRQRRPCKRGQRWAYHPCSTGLRFSPCMCAWTLKCNSLSLRLQCCQPCGVVTIPSSADQPSLYRAFFPSPEGIEASVKNY